MKSRSSTGCRYLRRGQLGRRGFTLVELLVVIVIIAMLVGLLVPAIQAAREAGRRATCINNQTNLGKAILSYASSKDQFPPGMYLQPGTGVGGVPPVSVGWVPPLLSFIEQAAYYKLFQQNQLSNQLSLGSSLEISLLVCPGRNQNNSPAPLTYVVNSGMIDRYVPVAGQQQDFRENGVFFDQFASALGLAAPTTTDISFISNHDGTSNTVLLSENIEALDWIAAPAALASATPTLYPDSSTPPQMHQIYQCPGWPAPTFGPQRESIWWQGIVWWIPLGAPTAFGTPNATMAAPTFNREIPQGNPITDQTNARPRSNHPGGFVLTMCGGNAQFVSEDIDYRVYCLLMAPDSQNAMWANASPSNVAWNSGSSNWHYPLDNASTPNYWIIPGSSPLQLKPATAADLNR